MTPCEKHPLCTDDGTCACAPPCDGHITCDKHFLEIVEGARAVGEIIVRGGFA